MMNENDLVRQLWQMSTPAASETTRERARSRAMIAFAHRNAEPPKKSVGGFAWAWSSAIALTVAAGLFVLVRFDQGTQTENLADDQQVLLQVEALFPNQVNAVVEQNGTTDLSIAQSPVVGAAQPVVVVFRHGNDTVRVLSYSGHHVCLTLGGRQRCFDILATPTDTVILESEDKVWLAVDHPEVDGYSMRARTLEAPL